MGKAFLEEGGEGGEGIKEHIAAVAEEGEEGSDGSESGESCEGGEGGEGCKGGEGGEGGEEAAGEEAGDFRSGLLTLCVADCSLDTRDTIVDSLTLLRYTNSRCVG